MTTAGWIMMTVSIGTVLSLVTFCLVKVLSLPPVEVGDMNVAPLEIDTHDQQAPE